MRKPVIFWFVREVLYTIRVKMGDLKYGDKRSNPDGGISLMARRIEFTHPVSGISIDLTAPVPDEPLWKALEAGTSDR